MSYKLFIGDTSATPLTFNSFKNVIGETHAGNVSFIGGQQEIRGIIDPAQLPVEAKQQWDEFTKNASRFYMLHFQSLDQAEATQEKLDKSDLPLIFFLGTHGAGDPP